ncbi:Tubulinyl-Tyr carboxypeptidase 1, variant 2 [Trebouxia sp. C0009 RCD-2024]
MSPEALVSQDLVPKDILPLASQWTKKWTLPLASGQTQSVEDFIKKASVLDLSQLGLQTIPRPVFGTDLEVQPVEQRLKSVQEYITAFQYNHTASTYFDQNKQRPLCRILSTARDIVRQGLPIKCVEAVFLALLLTAGWKDLDRIPVGFKTCVAGHVYRHIVLAVRHPETGQWGALGLSRRAELMDKALTYASLADLLQNYITSYMRWWHTVLRIRIGLPVPHDVMYDGQVIPLLGLENAYILTVSGFD